MDPLSIIASSIAVATPLTIGLQKLRDARHAKSELLLLSNEVAEIVVLLRELEQILIRRNAATGLCRPSPMLVQAVDDAKAKLQQLSAQFSEWDGRSPPQTLTTKSRGLRWVAMSSKVKAFKEDFGRIRERLMTILSTMNLSGSASVEMSLQEVFVFAKETTASQRVAHTELQNSLLERHNQMEELLRQLSRNIPPSGLPPSGDTGASIINERPGPISRALEHEYPVKAFHHNGSILFESAQMTSVAAVGIRTTQFPRTSCTPWCSCVCHRERRLRTPQILEQFVGSLFIGYSGLPVFRPDCNERSCHLQAQPLTYVTYFFPRWFLSRMVTFMMTVTPLAGPVASLKVQRTVPGSADIFTYAKLGDVDNIRRLFENGLASPHDVHSESGITPLHMVVNHQHIRATKFLLQANADPFMSDHSQCTSADNAWSKILSKSLKPDDERTLRDLFSETECVERREFTILHKIVLGLIQKDLEQELQASTADINVPEIIGRTPLSMAAERGEVAAVATLLQYGADPKISSYSQTSVLHYAVSAREPECLRLLLEAGVEVDCMSNWDQTPLLFAAAFTKDVRHAKMLLDYGAQPNLRDRDGMTALEWCAISDNPVVAAELLARGAYVQGIDNEGSSTLQRAIQSNRHEVLQLIVQKRPRIAECVPQNVSIWRLIATNADEVTMHILEQLFLPGAELDGADIAVSADEILMERWDSSPGLRAAFDSLVQRMCCLHSEDNEFGSEEDEDEWEDSRDSLDDG